MSNYQDVVLAQAAVLDPSKVRKMKLKGVVDSGAGHLVLPADAVKELGLAKSGKGKVTSADGRTARRDTVKDAYVEILGRHDTFSVLVEPGRKDALIGGIIVEVLDFLIDCKNQRMLPRDPKYIVSEIG